MAKSKKTDIYKVDYNSYISSIEWSNKRNLIIRKRGSRCEICREITGNPHVHHIHYANLGCEDAEDLQILCVPCHAAEHASRPRNSFRSKRSVQAYTKTLLRPDASRRFPKCYVTHGFVAWKRDAEKPVAVPESISKDGLTWRPKIRPGFGVDRFALINAAGYKCEFCSKPIKVDSFHVVDGVKASCGCNMAQKFLEDKHITFLEIPKHIRPMVSHRSR